MLYLPYRCVASFQPSWSSAPSPFPSLMLPPSNTTFPNVASLKHNSIHTHSAILGTALLIWMFPVWFSPKFTLPTWRRRSSNLPLTRARLDVKARGGIGSSIDVHCGRSISGLILSYVSCPKEIKVITARHPYLRRIRIWVSSGHQPHLL